MIRFCESIHVLEICGVQRRLHWLPAPPPDHRPPPQRRRRTTVLRRSAAAGPPFSAAAPPSPPANLPVSRRRSSAVAADDRHRFGVHLSSWSSYIPLLFIAKRRLHWLPMFEEFCGVQRRLHWLPCLWRFAGVQRRLYLRRLRDLRGAVWTTVLATVVELYMHRDCLMLELDLHSCSAMNWVSGETDEPE
ncbi:hypothetical protein F2Q69_00012132 [Brassica cretica]|uniref:Uncharacterized protein n=1 Tax=Brassica cretica TaxID=69181 RepID=A0A8S9R3Y8_BRACR|nr:hypothetical protein F2Q69_00012132 [Brassica cretica]